jgi:hypothetical protein
VDRPDPAVLLEVRRAFGVPVLGVDNRGTGRPCPLYFLIDRGDDRGTAGDMQVSAGIGKVILHVHDDKRSLVVVFDHVIHICSETATALDASQFATRIARALRHWLRIRLRKRSRWLGKRLGRYRLRKGIGLRARPRSWNGSLHHISPSARRIALMSSHLPIFERPSMPNFLARS